MTEDTALPEDDIARDIAKFVLNHKVHIEDGVSDFALLRGMLEVIEASLENE